MVVDYVHVRPIEFCFRYSNWIRPMAKIRLVLCILSLSAKCEHYFVHRPCQLGCIVSV